jgi:hypothetical protein
VAIPANSLLTLTGRVTVALRSATAFYTASSAFILAVVLRSGSGAPEGFNPSVVTDLSLLAQHPFAAPFAGQMTVSAAANNGSGAIRLTVNSTANCSSGNTVTVSGLTVCTEANATWAVTVVDGTHIDLRGSAIVHTGSDSGTAYLLGTIGLAFIGNTLQVQARGVKPAQWIQGESVNSGDVRWDATSNNTYVYTSNGTTNGSGTGPSGTGTSISDGTATCDFLAAGRSCPLVWLANWADADGI